ncbi:hypothetical protein [Streptomyces thermodiastaticus]|jgi:hypothetical protein|nr:hypothetical protein [Streptomyces thermodiastaticus]
MTVIACAWSAPGWSALGGDPALRRITVVEREGALGARLPGR